MHVFPCSFKLPRNNTLPRARLAVIYAWYFIVAITHHSAIRNACSDIFLIAYCCHVNNCLLFARRPPPRAVLPFSSFSYSHSSSFPHVLLGQWPFAVWGSPLPPLPSRTCCWASSPSPVGFPNVPPPIRGGHHRPEQDRGQHSARCSV